MEFNIGIFFAQLINFSIIFFLFKKFVGDKVSAMIQEKKEELRKADNANEVYENAILEAKKKGDEMLTEAIHHKETILEEAKQLANQEAKRIRDSAEKQAESIVMLAKDQSATLKKQMEDGFLDGVKRTTKLVVNKLINDDVDLQNTYIDGLVTEFAGKK